MSRYLLLAAATQAALLAGVGLAAAEPISVGAGRFVFAERGQPDLPVWTYRPARHTADDPVLVVMHGTRRNADDYRDAWVESSERLGVLLLVPEFTKRDYPARWGYQEVGVLDSAGSPRASADWTPQRVESLFDEVKRRNGLRAEGYFLYGHSAGGQFVHRAILTMPEMRVVLALPANAGWYTLPLLDTPYPEGLAGTPVTRGGLARSLAKPVVVLLGEADNDPTHKHLPRGAAAQRQGPHRFARGQHFFSHVQRAASELRCELAWRVEVAPGVPHSNSKMVPFAERLIAEHLDRNPLDSHPEKTR